MIKNLLRTCIRYFLFVLFILPQLVMAGSDDPQCEAEIPLTFTKKEMAEAGFEPGGFTPFILGMIAGPRIGLEWNDGRNVRTIEVLRALPYAGNLVGLFLCVEALSGYRMTDVAGETGIDDWRRKQYFKRIHKAEASADYARAAHLRECSPFNTYNHPANKLAIKPDENTGLAKWRSGLSGFFIDNRVGLEREESRGIRTVEYWSILWLPRIFPAIDAAQGETMSEIVREEHLDIEWLKKTVDADHTQSGVTP